MHYERDLIDQDRPFECIRICFVFFSLPRRTRGVGIPFVESRPGCFDPTLSSCEENSKIDLSDSVGDLFFEEEQPRFFRKVEGGGLSTSQSVDHGVAGMSNFSLLFFLPALLLLDDSSSEESGA